MTNQFKATLAAIRTEWPLNPTLWGLNEAVFNSTGQAHSESDVKGFFARAGFTGITVNEFIPGVLSRITGRKL